MDDFEKLYQSFLVDLNGDGKIDAREQAIAAKQAQQAVGGQPAQQAPTPAQPPAPANDHNQIIDALIAALNGAQSPPTR